MRPEMTACRFSGLYAAREIIVGLKASCPLQVYHCSRLGFGFDAQVL